MLSPVLENSAAPEAIPAPSTGLLAGTGMASGLGALLASSCCILPMALAGLGATGAIFSGLALLADFRPVLLGGAAILLTLSWALHLWRRHRPVCSADGSCAAPATSTRTTVTLGLGSVFVGLALAWAPYIEPILLKLLR